ncbi:hypothetical protein MMC28_011682 [Mycoblastus sanguinarius]|nr:hypothetical protein [Mycoblastus sanguinarius]
MLWCLQNSPRRALILLSATLKGRRRRPARNVIADCLNLLARHFLYKVDRPDGLALDTIRRLTFRFVDGSTEEEERAFWIPQHLAFLVLEHSDDVQAASLYETFVSNRVNLHPNTMLHFLERFVDMGKLYLSMKILRAIADSGFGLSHFNIQSACTKLLRAQFSSEQRYSIQSKILTQILEMGVRPGIALYNAIMLNTIEAGDFETAWQMYGVARENNLEPDSITYGVLLKGIKLSGKFGILERILRDAEENGVVLQDLRLVGDFLSSIFIQWPQEKHTAMLDFYKRHCDLRPLQELRMCEAWTKAPPDVNVDEKWPTSYILGQMVCSYVRLHQQSNDLINTYNLYHDLVKHDHPLIAPLAQTDHVANAFIYAFGRRPETLQHCTTVIKHMLESSPSAVDHMSHNPATATPTVRTWSILLAAYFYHNQRKAAEKVLAMMRERGLRLDKVTWNTIISGYSSMQEAEAAVGAMKQMEAEGFEVDNFTLKGLGRLRNRDLMLDALKRSMAKGAEEEGWSDEQGPDRKVVSEPVAPEEVEEMSKGWEADVVNRRREVERYLKAFCDETLNPSTVIQGGAA